MLLRLEAARSRLSSHHSASHSSMQRRGGGGGVGGGGDVRAARQLLLSIFDGAVAGGGAGGRRGKGASSGGGWLGASSRPREGEWSCQCGFGTNRPHRTACFACGRPRAGAEVGGAAARQGGGGRWATEKGGPKGGRPCMHDHGHQQGKGPVGAGGSRPLLGWGGRGLQGGTAGGGHCKGFTAVPNWSDKGPPPAAAGGKGGGRPGANSGGGGKSACKGGAGGDGGKATPIGDGGGSGSGWSRPPAVYDDDGFELVQPRRVRAGGGHQDNGAVGGKGTSDSDTTTRATRPRWADVDGSDDDIALEGCDGADEDGDADEGEDGEERPADPRKQRAEFEELARAVKEMEKRGQQGAALGTLRAARDEAERRWRETKPPAPLPKRLEWAEGKLRRAQSTFTRLRMDLDAFDEETDRRRAELCERIQQAQEWCTWRQRQLDDLHAEAADKAPGRREAASRANGATQLQRRIRGQTLPEMQAILEEVQEGTPLHARMALLVADLVDAEAQANEQQWEEGPTQYHLYDGDSTHEEQEDGDDDMCDMGGPCDGAGVEEERRDGPISWKPEGPSRWSKTGGGKGKGKPPRRDGDKTANAGPLSHEDGGRATGAKGGDGGAPAAGSGQEAPSGSDGGETSRAGKFRRRCSDEEAKASERAESDARRARELQKQLEQATTAQQQSFEAGRGGFGSEAALSMAAQKFVMDVQRAQAQAGEMGIEPVASDGRALLQLSPAELQQWVADHLEDTDTQI